jgi:hypothetical protein
MSCGLDGLFVDDGIKNFDLQLLLFQKGWLVWDQWGSVVFWILRYSGNLDKKETDQLNSIQLRANRSGQFLAPPEK